MSGQDVDCWGSTPGHGLYRNLRAACICAVGCGEWFVCVAVGLISSLSSCLSVCMIACWPIRQPTTAAPRIADACTAATAEYDMSPCMQAARLD